MNSIREQYEQYPYPSRNPQEERHRLIVPLGDSLAAIDHAGFGGRRDWTKPFRVLDAGGGTGDTTIAMGQQLTDRNIPGEVVYLDLSSASRRIAEERAANRGLKNITFRTGSVLDLSRETDGTFDWINCSGMLHHLENPAFGLQSLVNVLAPDGGMVLMVYGALGRAGVYPAQDMLRQIAPPSEPAEQRIATTKLLLDALPATNLLVRSKDILDYRANSASGLFDLLLHSVDRAYLIGEFDALLRNAGLRISTFVTPFLYDLANWCENQELLSKVMRLDEIGRAAFTERFTGIINRHEVFVVRTDNPVAHPALRPGSVPVWAIHFKDTNPDQPVVLHLPLQSFQINISFVEAESRIIRLIDGKRTISEIAATAPMAPEQFNRALARVWKMLNGLAALYLRA